jgi:Fe-S oxidoreductase
MDSDCLMFPELYRLYDQEMQTGKKITSNALRQLVDRCNFCALCPCPNIRADIIKAKTEFIARDGLKFGEVSERMVYYPPCHLREQNIDRPYQELLNLLPGIKLDPVNGNLYCCGMAGIMGFKRVFHETSVRLGNRLMAKIKELKPEKLVTDCLSCRLQFNQLLPYKVFHPIEILNEAYSNPKGRCNH